MKLCALTRTERVEVGAILGERIYTYTVRPTDNQKNISIQRYGRHTMADTDRQRHAGRRRKANRQRHADRERQTDKGRQTEGDRH